MMKKQRTSDDIESTVNEIAGHIALLKNDRAARRLTLFHRKFARSSADVEPENF